MRDENVHVWKKSTSNLTSVDFLDTTTFKGDTFQESHILDKVFFKARLPNTLIAIDQSIAKVVWVVPMPFKKN